MSVALRTIEPPSWQRELRRSITSLEALEARLTLTPEERLGVQRAQSAGLPMAITEHYFSLIDPNNPECPIRKQCVPTAQESSSTRGDLEDPLGEIAHEVAPHLVQRYPDRVLLLATDHCGVYCRFCTRSRMVGDGAGATPEDALDPAFAYLAAHPEIRDVIVSGGDPLVMATSRLARLIARIRTIPHVETIRLATRAPVTLPARITAELLDTLRPHHPIWVMTHFNHPKELDAEARAACTRLADAGFPVMNQTVLLRGINDDSDTLESLFRALVRVRVRPYYLLQMDPVQGSGHLRTPLARGVELIGALQGRLTGIAMPKFICDTPGGKGKVPLGPASIVAHENGITTLRTFRGELVDYIDP